MPAKDLKSKDAPSSQEVYQALCGAASQDAVTVKASSEALQDYIGRPGTYGQLHSIASEKGSVPLDVRRMAMILFKNGALGVWKNKRLFNEDARQAIRARSLMFLHEDDNIIADCNAVVVSKLARVDFPTSWPSLVSDLTTAIENEIQRFLSNPTGSGPANTLFLKRTLKVLDRVLKEISTVKMPVGLRTMAQLAEALYSPLISHYDRLSGLLRTSLTPEALLDPHLQHTCEEVVELTHIVFKPCVKIMLWLWQKFGQPEYRAVLDTLSSFAQSCFQLARVFFDLRVQLVMVLRDVSSGTHEASNSAPAIPITTMKSLHQLTRHIRLYGKMFRRMQQLDVKKFISLPQANELVQYYWGEVVKAANGPPEFISDSPDAVYPVRILVQGMVLFRENLAAWSGKKNTVEVLSEEFVREAVRILLTRFIPLDSTNLSKWEMDPEEWVNEEEKGGDAWEYDLRPCSERVLMTICIHYHQYVVPLLLKMLEEVLGSSSGEAISVLQKEAVYCAIGRCARHLQGKLDFDDWLQNHLILEAQQPDKNYRIIKRRIAWVIGKWHSAQCTSRSKVQVWELLLHLLRDRGDGSDPVVRLTAAEALKECIDTIEFEVQPFLPFLRDFLAEVMRLTFEADLMEVKKRLINTINIIIERAGINIVPYMSAITDPLPQLWQESGDDYLLKATLLVTVTHLVQAAKEHSASLSNIVISLVQESFSPSAKLLLDVDGLILWQAAIRNATDLSKPRIDTPGYIDLFPHAISLVSENLDLLGSILSIVQSYILLDGPKIITAYGLDLFRAFGSAMPRAVQTNVKDILLTINMIAQAVAPAQYVEAMHLSGLFAVLVKDVIKNESPALLLTEYIYVFARIALWEPIIFNQLVMASAPAVHMSESQVIEGVLDQWWSKFDNMAEPRHRKLTAMGIAGWVSTACGEVLGRLNTEVFNIWLDVFGEVKEALAEQDAVEGTQSPLKMFWLNSAEQIPAFPQGVEGTIEENRWRQLHLVDPVNREKLSMFIKARLQQAEENAGGAQIFRATYLDKADPTVLGQITAELMTGN